MATIDRDNYLIDRLLAKQCWSLLPIQKSFSHDQKAKEKVKRQ